MTPDLIQQLEPLSRQPLGEALNNPHCGVDCPVADKMGLSPSDIARMLREGEFDELLSHKALWVCTGCRACAGLLGETVDFTRALDALRQLAANLSNRPEAGFVRRFMTDINRTGRLNERKAFGPYIAKTGGGMLAAALFFKGKLRIRHPGVTGWEPVETVLEGGR